MFLPDRYIKGECPKCGAKDQYGDACEVCGAVYAPTDLKNPYSTLSGATPVMRSSEHFFFRLSDPRASRSCAVDARPAPLQPEVANKAQEWLGEGGKALGDWDISRDAPYFGDPDPRRAGQVLLRLARRADRLPGAELLEGATANRRGARLRGIPRRPRGRAVPLHRQGHRLLPHAVLAGDAASSPGAARCRTTSSSTASSPSAAKRCPSRAAPASSPLRYLDLGMNPEWLRYYIAAKLNASVEDVDFNPDDFIARVNSDLVGKYVNIASRAANFITRISTGSSARRRQPTTIARPARASRGCEAEIARADTRRANSARRCATRCASPTGSTSTFDAAQPWELAKDPAPRDRLHEVCTARSRASSCSPCPGAGAARGGPRVARELFGLGRLRGPTPGRRPAAHRPVPAT